MTDICERNDPELIPRNIRAALDEYAESHIPRGSFLRCVLSNDLAGAVMRADTDNIRVIRSIVGYVINYLPRDCHGSPEKYKSWTGGV